MQMVPPGEYFTTGESRQSSASGNNLFEFFPYPFIFQLVSPASGLTFSCPFMKLSEAATSILMISSFLGLQYQVACTILELTVRWKDEVQMKLCLGKGDDLFTK